MKLSEWIEKGTIVLPRYDGVIFTVIQPSSIFLGLYDPKKLKEEYEHEPKTIDYLTNFLCKQFGYNYNLVNNREIKVSPKNLDSNRKRNTRDINGISPSWKEEGVEYTTTLMDIMPLLFNKELPSLKEIEDEVINWTVLDWRCDCGRGGSVDEYCSVPSENLVKWGIPEKEYKQDFNNPRKPKHYGKVPCKHVIEGLFKSGRYPMSLNYERYNSAFLKMGRDIVSELITFEQSGQLTGNKIKDNLKKQQVMDVVLKPHIMEMGFGYIEDYIRQLYLNEVNIRDSRERLKRRFGLPQPRFIKS